jgi:hypothetical protein
MMRRAQASVLPNRVQDPKTRRFVGLAEYSRRSWGNGAKPGRVALVASNVDHDCSGSGMMAMLPEVDSLPGA